MNGTNPDRLSREFFAVPTFWLPRQSRAVPPSNADLLRFMLLFSRPNVLL